MKRKEQSRELLLRMRLSLKGSLFFIIILLLFICGSILGVTIGGLTQPSEMVTFYAAVYVYFPVVFTFLINSKEVSKIYYLIPQTREEKRQFILYEVRMKTILSIFSGFVFFLITILLNPVNWRVNLMLFAITNIAYALVAAGQGINQYYRKCENHTKPKSWKVIFYNIYWMIGMLSLYFGAIFAIRNGKMDVLVLISVIALLISVAYYLHAEINFAKCEVCYEELKRDDKRVMSCGKQTLM